MKRIRYKKEADLLVSEPMMAGLNEIVVILDPSKLQYTIRFDSNVNSLGTAVSLQMLKKRAKEAVIAMGVKFEDEVRPRTKL